MADSQMHIVLVPGFGGFDALGQIEYYAGVTGVFSDWRNAAAEGSAASRATLRYFDNLPTSAVKTRAAALHDYLAKREARREFQPSDRIALVAHSTGGLDIRQLLSTLCDASEAGDGRPVDGGQEDAVRVADAALFSRIKRLCFLSVPQRGTNIADCVKAHLGLVHLGVTSLDEAVRALHLNALASLERRVAAHIPENNADVLLAVRDAYVETLPPQNASDGYAAALARAAFGELTGFLGNVSADFLAIDDLAFTGPACTPARFDDERRKKERDRWARNGIRTCSYATLGRPPFDREPSTDGAHVRSLAELSRALLRGDDSNRTDFTYRVAHAACAAGPFQVDPSNDSATDHQRKNWKLAAWQNDGIVNTASMLWPDGPRTTIVHADHGDIIGHYKRSPAVSPEEVRTGRANHSYDIFRSSSGFGDQMFERVWKEIFEFCVRSDE
jgi:hypothetical protein